jgi:hypothetical protein
MSNDHGRKPFPSKRLVDLLVESGAEGKTVAELANALYGESTHRTRCRVHGLIGHLRWNGHKIRAIRDKGYAGHRYVLGQFVVTAVNSPSGNERVSA